MYVTAAGSVSVTIRDGAITGDVGFEVVRADTRLDITVCRRCGAGSCGGTMIIGGHIGFAGGSKFAASSGNNYGIVTGGNSGTILGIPGGRLTVRGKKIAIELDDGASDYVITVNGVRVAATKNEDEDEAPPPACPYCTTKYDLPAGTTIGAITASGNSSVSLSANMANKESFRAEVSGNACVTATDATVRVVRVAVTTSGNSRAKLSRLCATGVLDVAATGNSSATVQKTASATCNRHVSGNADVEIVDAA